MVRTAVVFLALVALCLYFCNGKADAYRYYRARYSRGGRVPSHRSMSQNGVRKCVYASHPYSYYSSQVATCEYSEVLENAISDTEQKITTLEQKIDNDTSALQQQVLQLTNEVGLLNGNGKQMFKVIAGTPELGFRRFCELYTFSEISDACIFFGFPIPDVHAVHLDCGDGDEFVEPCPETFWKIQVGCYRPNGPRFRDCAYDPVPLNENCTRLLYISCDGYTTNIGDDWMKLDFNKADSGEVAEHDS